MPERVGRWLLLAAAVLTFLVWLIPIGDNDYGLHLRLGADTVARGRPPQDDHHSHTADGAHYPDHEWLAQVLFYGVHSLGGDAAMVALQAALAATAVLLSALIVPGPPLFRLIQAGLVFFLGHYHVQMRPHLLAWCLMALLILLLERRRYWVVPLLLVLWSNLHASVLLGVGLAGLRLLEEALATRSRRFVYLGAAVAAAPLLNPYGWHAFALFFRISAHTDFVNEWQPFGTETAGFAVLVLLFVATVAGLLLSRTRSPGDALRVAVLGYVGFTASRNAVVAAIALAPLLGRWYGPALARLGRRPSIIAGAAVLAMPVGLGVHHASSRELFRFGLNPLHLPVESVAFLERHRLPNPLFNDYNFGGYLLWAAPERRVFVDGRLEVYGGKVLDDYLQASRGESGWRRVLDEHGVKTALLRPERPLVRALLGDPGWDLLYFDYNSVVFVRSGEASGRRRLVNLSPFGNRDRSKPAEALEEIKYLLTENPRFFGGYKIQAFLQARLGDIQGSAAALDRHVELHPTGAKAADVRALRSQLAARGVLPGRREP